MVRREKFQSRNSQRVSLQRQKEAFTAGELMILQIQRLTERGDGIVTGVSS
jgi:predicted RNA-binding protein with TRAM domain